MTTASISPPAVILAAGRGSRLGDLTSEKPKALLEVCGKTLLARQLETLQSSGIGRIHILTGFARELFAPYWSEGVSEIHNAGWAEANNLVSLDAAGEILDKGFILLNADLLFHPRMLAKLLRAEAPCALMVDNEKALADEEMKVLLDSGGRMTDISKTIAPPTAAGEYIGLAKFGSAGAAVLRREMAAIIARGGTGEWYEAAFKAAAPSVPIQACLTEGLPWIEIDTPEDLAEAQSVARMW